MIQSRDLRKSYGDREVLRGVSLSVQKGEVFGFVGPNGAGKTTFLKCLAGITRPKSGSLEVCGVNVLKNPLAARKRIGYAPGETSLYESMRVKGFLQFCLSFYKTADYSRAIELANEFALPLTQRVRELSHGMKRKLLLIQAITSGGEVILLDEPMEGLDPEARRKVESMLRDLAAQGRTIFFSSHDLSSIERVCNRVGFLRKGELVRCGTLEEVMSDASQFLQLRFQEEDREEIFSALQDLPAQTSRVSGDLEDVFENLYGPDCEEKT
ncbi:MAG: ABC transporter ATP-binding protein [Planctomycetota bacterium]|nr:ABC transporter ATP-binding protein [Planctomycetota bacterium]